MIKPLYKRFEKDFINFWELLDVEYDEPKEKIDMAYKKKLKDSSLIDEYYVAWKLLRDKNFEKLYKRSKSLDVVYDAGFFLDSLEYGESLSLINPDFISIPVHKAKLSKNKKNIVLVSTGGFSPVHNGHIYTLESAKKELELDGYNVVCGYLSPSHDDYVSTKDNGKAHNYALNRIKDCNEMIDKSNWLMTSPNESVYTRTSINYTDVLINIKKYVRKNISSDIIIGYVFGGDNAPFIKAFEDNEDIAICVTRNNDREGFIEKEDLSYCNFKYIRKNPFTKESSTKIRKNKTTKDKVRKSKNYLIRNDYDMFNFPKDISPINKIKKALEECLKDSIVSTVDVNIQLIEGEKRKLLTENRTISLDVYIKGDINIPFSRLFNISDSQIKCSRLTSRPENEPFVDFDKLIESRYTLIEDDIVSGFTLNSLRDMMPKKSKIEDFIILSDFNKNKECKEYYDVVDLRDFIINIPYSGLVVSFLDDIFRAPYILPYVDVTTRASVRPEKALYFSKRILEINIEFYQEIKKLNIDIELSDSISKLCDVIKIKKEVKNVDTVLMFCIWHLEKIKGIIN